MITGINKQEYNKIVNILIDAGYNELKAKVDALIFLEVYKIKGKAYYQENKERIKLRDLKALK